MVAILVANGFEIAEALGTLDLLHRADVDAYLATLDSDEVASADGIVVKADKLLKKNGVEKFAEELDMLILAGGTGNVNILRSSPAAEKLIRKVAADGKKIAAICAAPTLLAGLGLTNGKKTICYPGLEQAMGKTDVQIGSKVVVDGNIITGQGPGAVFDFALKLIEILKGKEIMQKVKDEIHYQD